MGGQLEQYGNLRGDFLRPMLAGIRPRLFEQPHVILVAKPELWLAAHVFNLAPPRSFDFKDEGFMMHRTKVYR